MSDLYGRKPAAQKSSSPSTTTSKRFVDPVVSNSPSRMGSSARRSASGDRGQLSASGSPMRASSGYARSVSALSSTSRYDAVSNRLRVEEELWQQQVDASSQHRREVAERARQVEEAKKRRAHEVLTQEMERSHECISANQQAFHEHLDKCHKMQSLRQQHVADQARARRQWEEELARVNDERTTSAAHKYSSDIAARRSHIHERLTTRGSAAKERLSHLERERQKARAAKNARDSEQAREAYRELVARRHEQLDKHIQHRGHAAHVAQRAAEIQRRRVEEALAKEREADRRSKQALRAHASAVDTRRQRKDAHAAEAREKIEAAKERDAMRRASYEAHFDETLAVGEETSSHNRRVHRVSTSSQGW